MNTLPRNAQRLLFQGGIPVTLLLIAANVLTFFTSASMRARDPLRYGVFLGSEWPREFWTALTWPLYSSASPIALIFAALWAYSICGSLERSWGWRAFGLFFFASNLLTALAAWAGAQMFGTNVALMGLHVGVCAPTVAWAAVNRRETVNFWGVLPIPAVGVAVLAAVILWYDVNMASGSPLVGVVALAGCAAAWWYALHGRYLHRGYARDAAPGGAGKRGGKDRPALRLHNVENAPKRGGSPFGWFKARKEQKQLENLWKRSGMDEPKERR